MDEYSENLNAPEDIKFLTVKQIITIQSETLPRSGLPNMDRLEGALGRIYTLYSYEECNDIFKLAAMYIIAIAKAHAFNDANKRTALQAALVFLRLHGIRIEKSLLLVKLTIWAAMDKAELDNIAITLQLLSDINGIPITDNLEPDVRLFFQALVGVSNGSIDDKSEKFISQLLSDLDNDLLEETTSSY